MLGVWIRRHDAPNGAGVEIGDIEGAGDVATGRRGKRVVDEDRQQKRRLEEKSEDAAEHVHPPAERAQKEGTIIKDP